MTNIMEKNHEKNHLSSKQALIFNVWLLRIEGLWPIRSKQGSLYYIYTTFVILVFIIFFLINFLRPFTNWGELGVIASLSVTLTNFTACTKLFTIITRREKIDQMVDFIEKGCSENSHDSYETVRIKTETAKQAEKRSRQLTKYYCGLFAITAVIWQLTPLTMPVEGKVDSSNVSMPLERPLPFYTWLPFDTNPTPNYEFAYGVQIVLSTIEALTISAMDMFYTALIIHTCGLFEILKTSLKHVKIDALLALRKIKLKKKFKSKTLEFLDCLKYKGSNSLAECGKSTSSFKKRVRIIEIESIGDANLDTETVYGVGGYKEEEIISVMETELTKSAAYHQSLLKHCIKLEEILSPIVFIEFLVVSFNLCLVGFQATVMTVNSIQFVTTVGYLLCVLLQLYFLCYYGDELQAQSLDVHHAAYDCQWHESSSSFKRSVRFVIMRAQRPVKITAGKFGLLNLESFNRLVQTAYSYFAVLRSLHEA